MTPSDRNNRNNGNNINRNRKNPKKISRSNSGRAGNNNNNNNKNNNNRRNNSRNTGVKNKSGENNIYNYNMPGASAPASTSTSTPMSGTAGTANYSARLRNRAGNADKNQKFHNFRRVITTGKDLTTPMEKSETSLNSANAKPKVSIKEKRVKVATDGMPLSVIFWVTMSSIFLLGYLLTQMILGEYTENIVKTQTGIDKAIREERLLTRQLEAKDDLAEFERIAVEELGMIKEDLLLKKYISLKQKDKVEIMGDSEDIFTKFFNGLPWLSPFKSEEK
jgi:hypothetical protein